jgi:DNA polymerase
MPRRSRHSAAPFLPSTVTLASLQSAAAACTGCDLYKHATQTVFGEGGTHARIVFIGEQPGDQEDREGRPFVGPAGRVLDRALAEAGIARRLIYVTNAVKHFKWEPQGKRRKHKKPSASEIAACKPWLDAELGVVRPDAVVCLGVTAAQAVFGQPVRVQDLRGKGRDLPGIGMVFVTIHPSAVLRSPDARQREEAYRKFVADLRSVATSLEERAA